MNKLATGVKWSLYSFQYYSTDPFTTWCFATDEGGEASKTSSAEINVCSCVLVEGKTLRSLTVSRKLEIIYG